MRTVLLSIVLSVTACNNGGAHFSTETASDFTPASHTVSVLGVYKDGRMAVDVWDQLAPHLADALASAPCDIGFDSLVTSNQELADAIDERARAEGPNDLLAQLAPAARGDLLLVLTFSGKPPQQQTLAEPPAGAPVNNSMGSPRKRGAHSGNGHGADPNRLEVSAALFSVAQNRPFALLGMTYGGQSVDDAMTRFGAELARTIPHSKCVGWNWDVKIDPATLRSHVGE
ncbi:MAG: hypothetical protein WDO69_09115 [Pseudomonadota bacterium]